MEKFQFFERKCPKACLGLYIEPEENYRKRVKNKKIYEIAQAPRIDVFIIYLIRKIFPNDNYYAETCINGFVPPDN